MNENTQNTKYLKLEHLSKEFDGINVLDDFNIDINNHEFIVIVGPSGCGKTTLLRIIAGLEKPSQGDIYLLGKKINDLPPKKRDISMVFQTFALYQRMSIYENMSYALEVRKLDKKEIKKRIEEASKILQLEPYLQKKPNQLSGGQCQRAALGRAMVKKSKVYLMDEPLSNLDAKLKVQMRAEIVKLHKEVGSTTVYVTHDQSEAMIMADRVVVMNNGKIEQVDSPINIYLKPKNLFVATFIGSPSMNVLEGTYYNGHITFEDGKKIQLSQNQIDKHDAYYKDLEYIYSRKINEFVVIKNDLESKINEKTNDKKIEELSYEIDKLIMLKECAKAANKGAHKINIGIRPESVRKAVEDDDFAFDGKINLMELVGNDYFVHVNWNKTDIIAKLERDSTGLAIDKVISLSFDTNKMYLFDPLTDKTII